MAVLDRQQVFNVSVDYYSFSLQDDWDTEVPVEYPDDLAELGSGLLTEFEGRVDIESAAHGHKAVLTAEVWDAEPPEDHREEWEATGEAKIRSVSGKLAVWVMAGPEEDRLDLGSPGAVWRVRVYCTGRAEVARLAPLGVPEGVERYVAQFWPSEG